MSRQSDDEQLQEKLDRVSQRLQIERDRVRQALEFNPDLLHLAKLTKETFDARFTYLRCGGYEKGTDLPPGIVPKPYHKPPRGKGRIAWLRGMEEVK